MLKRGGNVLLLDEPTNDLDVETLGALEEAIENFAGCAVVISHDRFFSTVWRRTSSRSRGIHMSSGSRGTSMRMKRTSGAGLAMRRIGLRRWLIRS